MTKESLKQSVMKELESGSVKQTATWVFIAKEYGLWLIAGVTIIFGSVSMAIIFASVDDLRSTLYALQTSGVKGFVLFMPYLWLVGMVGFFYLGYNHIRKTKQGYRYPLFALMGTIVVVSCIGGATLYATGIANDVDGYLAERVDVYRKYGNPQHTAWRSPLDGRLAGVILNINTSTCEIRDVHGAKWVVELTSATATEKLALTENMHIRVIGERTATGTFHASDVWVKSPVRRVHHKLESEYLNVSPRDIIPTSTRLLPHAPLKPIPEEIIETNTLPIIDGSARMFAPLEIISAR